MIYGTTYELFMSRFNKINKYIIITEKTENSNNYITKKTKVLEKHELDNRYIYIIVSKINKEELEKEKFIEKVIEI